MKKKNEEVTFADILGIFIPKIWIIAIVSVLFAVIMGAHTSLTVKDTYTTQTVFRVKSTSNASLSEQTFVGVDIELKNFEYKLRADDFFVQVVADLNEYYPGEYSWISSAYISSVVRYAPLGDGMLLISVTSQDALLSYRISQSLLSVIPKSLIEDNQGKFEIMVSDYPDENPGVNAKPVTKKAVIGFAIGAVLSAAAVWVCSALDVVVRNKKKIEDYFEIPVIAVIPVKKSGEAGESQNV